MSLLRYQADRRSLALVGAWTSIVVLQWLWHPSSLWVALPLLALTCCLAFLGAVITHNTVHAPVFRSRKLNRLFQVVLTLMYGHPVSAFVPGHNLSHHRFTESERDVIRTSKARFRLHCLNLLCFFFIVSRDVVREEFRYIRAARRTRRSWYRQLCLEGSVFILSSAALLWLDWWKFVLYFALPSFYASWGIITMNLLQHDGCDATHPYNHSRTFVGRTINWITFNNGYHGVHHLKPSLHWSELPKAHQELVAPHLHPGLVQPSFGMYLLRTFFMPGGRRRYDGAPLHPKSPGFDQDWIGAAV